MQSQIDHIVREFFLAFDNRNGRRVDLGALRPLFVPGALIVKNTLTASETMSVDEFIRPRQALLTGGGLVDFHEWEVDSSTFVFGGIACRTLRYAKDGILQGIPFSGEGVKSLHLSRSDAGWRISSMVWQDAEPGLPIDVIAFHVHPPATTDGTKPTSAPD